MNVHFVFQFIPPLLTFPAAAAVHFWPRPLPIPLPPNNFDFDHSNEKARKSFWIGLFNLVDLPFPYGCNGRMANIKIKLWREWLFILVLGKSIGGGGGRPYWWFGYNPPMACCNCNLLGLLSNQSPFIQTVHVLILAFHSASIWRGAGNAREKLMPSPKDGCLAVVFRHRCSPLPPHCPVLARLFYGQRLSWRRKMEWKGGMERRATEISTEQS